MNRNIYRIVFNRTLGLFQVVAEIARRDGRRTGPRVSAARSRFLATLGPLRFAVAFALGQAVIVPQANAQIVADPGAPGNQRPTVLEAPNGVPLVNIQTPARPAFRAIPTGSSMSGSRAPFLTTPARTRKRSLAAGYRVIRGWRAVPPGSSSMKSTPATRAGSTGMLKSLATGRSSSSPTRRVFPATVAASSTLTGPPSPQAGRSSTAVRWRVIAFSAVQSRLTARAWTPVPRTTRI